MREEEARAALVAYGQSLFSRGYSCGTSGNLSVRVDEGGYLMSPTNVSLGRLKADSLSRLDEDARHIDGPPPTKESWLHRAMYSSRPADTAVVHLHSTYAVALSCRTDLDSADMLPPMTPYVVMKVGRVPRIPYSRPGDTAVAPLVSEVARSHRALLLANHGPVVAGVDLDAAVSAAEELEETAHLFFILEWQTHSQLGPKEIEELHRAFSL